MYFLKYLYDKKFRHMVKVFLSSNETVPDRRSLLVDFLTMYKIISAL